MTEWRTYKLGEVCNILDYRRIPLSAQQRATRKGKYPYYGAQGIIDYVDDYIFDGTYLLIAEDGENLRSKKQNIAQLVSGKYWVNNHAHIVESNGLCDIRYICYLLNCIDISGYITGSAQPKLNQANLLAITLSLPSLEEQRRIAGILGAIDDKIENNRRINANLEQQAQALFDKIFFSNNDWVCSTLGDLTEEVKERVKGRDAKVLSPISSGELVLSEDYFTKQVYSQDTSKYIIVEPNHFAYNPARINIGSIGINTFDFIGCVSPVYVVFRAKNEYESYVRMFVRSDIFKEEVKSRAIGGVRQTLSYQDFAMIETKHPPIETVRTFNSQYMKILNLIEHNLQENNNLATLRDTLLPKLMNGEIKL